MICVLGNFISLGSHTHRWKARLLKSYWFPHSLTKDLQEMVAQEPCLRHTGGINRLLILFQLCMNLMLVFHKYILTYVYVFPEWVSHKIKHEAGLSKCYLALTSMVRVILEEVLEGN